MKKDESLMWEEISRETVVRDRWIDFRRSAYRFPDGRVFQPYYSYTRRDFAVVVASDEEGRLICVRQFRQGIGKVTTEFPAGAVEKTDGSSDGPAGTAPDAEAAALAAARRELREETGYVSDSWRHLLTIPANATLSDNYAYLFAADRCRREAEQDLDEMELLRVCLHTPQEIDDLLAEGAFEQAVHGLAWLLWRGRPARP